MTLSDAHKELGALIFKVEEGEWDLERGKIELELLRERIKLAGLDMKISDSVVTEAHDYYQNPPYESSYESSWDEDYESSY